MKKRLTVISIAAAMALSALSTSAQETSQAQAPDNSSNTTSNIPETSAASTQPLTEDTPAPIALQVVSSLVYPDGSTLKSRPSEVQLVKAVDMQKSTAGKVALGVLMFAFAGGTGFTTNSKETMRGNPLEGLEDRSNLQIPLNTFVGQLQAQVNTAIQANPDWTGKTFKKPLVVAGGIVNLVYESLTGDESDLYRVKADWIVSKSNESFTFFANPYAKVDCSYQSATPQSLETWANNNYAQVKTELETQFSQCAQKVLAALPDLLKK